MVIIPRSFAPSLGPKQHSHPFRDPNPEINSHHSPTTAPLETLLDPYLGHLVTYPGAFLIRRKRWGDTTCAVKHERTLARGIKWRSGNRGAKPVDKQKPRDSRTRESSSFFLLSLSEVVLVFFLVLSLSPSLPAPVYVALRPSFPGLITGFRSVSDGLVGWIAKVSIGRDF